MTRISSKELKKYPWYMRLFFRMQKKKYGSALEPTLLWGRMPTAFLGFSIMYKSLNRKSSPLSPELRALVMTKVSEINQCAFCIDMNAFFVLESSHSEDKIETLSHYRESDVFSKKEKTVLEYAQIMTERSHEVPEEIFQRLKEYYEEDAIVELTALIAFQNLSSKFNAVLDVKAFGFCKR